MTGKLNYNRRDFLKRLGLAGAGLYLVGCAKQSDESLTTPFSQNTTSTPEVNAEQNATDGDVYLAVARGDNVAEMTRRALAAIGGMERFIAQGAKWRL